MAFSGIHTDLKVGCSAPHKDEGRDVLLSRGYFATEQDKSSKQNGTHIRTYAGMQDEKEAQECS